MACIFILVKIQAHFDMLLIAVEFCFATMSVVFFAHSLGCVLFYFRGEIMSKEFGEHLRKLRKEKTDYSQQQMADLLSISRSTYTYYETGNSEPSNQNLKKLAKFFDVDFNTLFDYEE